MSIDTKAIELCGLEWKKIGNPTEKKEKYYLRDSKNKLRHLQSWWLVTEYTKQRATVVGWRRAFEETNLLGDMFSIKA